LKNTPPLAPGDGLDICRCYSGEKCEKKAEKKEGNLKGRKMKYSENIDVKRAK
jgi:hypothetical protein